MAASQNRAPGAKRSGGSVAALVTLILAFAAILPQAARLGADEGGSLRISVTSASEQTGAMRVAVAGCDDQPSTLDEIRYRIFDSAGSVVRTRTVPVTSGRSEQVATIGDDLPAGTYSVEAQCLANGRATGAHGSATESDRVVTTSSAQSSAPGLPHSGS